jgi:DNA-binding response OmpR family regulator
MTGTESLGVPADMMDLSPPIILVVEDDRSIREVLTTFLRQEGYAVEEAADGAAALRALEAHRPPPAHYSAVLLDLILPRVSGVAVLDQMHDALDDYVPVVAMSASPLALEVASTVGAVASLRKPFDLTELLAIVSRYCSSPATSPAPEPPSA